MKKRILALLLAALLLPVCALAEAFRMEVSISVDVDNAAEIFRSAGIFAGASNEDELCRSFAGFMDGASLSVTTQEDAVRLDVAFDETNLLDLSVITHGTELFITSELMDGGAMSIPMDQMSAENDAFTRLLMETNWLSLLGGMLDAAVASFDGVEGTTVRGSFSGDAYTGGVYCTTYTFDDKTVAGLVSALLTEDFRALVLEACGYWNVDGAAFLAQIDGKNASAAEANTHRYIVRLVYDEQSQPLGMSALVLQGDDQLGTFSLGFADEKIRLVVGFGLDDVNYWHAQEINLGRETGEDGLDTIIVSGSLLEFTAPKMDDFAYASATYTDLRMQKDWQVNLMMQGDNLSWQYTVNERMGQTAPLARTEGQGLYLPGKRLVNNVTYSQDGLAYMTEKMVWAPCDPIDTNVEGLNAVSVLADDSALNELGMTMGFALAERLMKVFPMQLLMFFQ